MTFSTRSRYANSVRQSPSAANSESSTAISWLFGHRELELLERRRAPALELLVVDLGGAEALDLGAHDLLDLVDVLGVADLRVERRDVRIVRSPAV